MRQVTNRRAVLAMGAAACVGGVYSWSARVGGSGSIGRDEAMSSRVPVVFDDRFDTAQAFAKAARVLGFRTLSVKGDVYDLWRAELSPRGGDEPVAFVGMTSASSLFCLQQLAANHWMRLRYRADHEPVCNGGTKHHIAGARCLVQRGERLIEANDDWVRHAAYVVTRAIERGSGEAKTTLVSTSRLYALNRGPSETLVSWVITPRVASNF